LRALRCGRRASQAVHNCAQELFSFLHLGVKSRPSHWHGKRIAQRKGAGASGTPPKPTLCRRLSGSCYGRKSATPTSRSWRAHYASGSATPALCSCAERLTRCADFEKPAAPMMFGDSKFRQIMAAAAERGQRDLDEFAKIVTTYGKAMGLVPSLPAADDTDDQVGTILPASISPDHPQ
jgi:hypothetical protein